MESSAQTLSGTRLYSIMNREPPASFAGDLPEQEQKLVWATHAAPAADLFNQKVEGTAWRSKPSWYVLGINSAISSSRPTSGVRWRRAASDA